MQELILFYSLLSVAGLMGVGYSLYVYHMHKKSKRK
jgi:hypothetical protein